MWCFILDGYVICFTLSLSSQRGIASFQQRRGARQLKRAQDYQYYQLLLFQNLVIISLFFFLTQRSIDSSSTHRSGPVKQAEISSIDRPTHLAMIKILNDCDFHKLPIANSIDRPIDAPAFARLEWLKFFSPFLYKLIKNIFLLYSSSFCPTISIYLEEYMNYVADD